MVVKKCHKQGHLRASSEGSKTQYQQDDVSQEIIYCDQPLWLDPKPEHFDARLLAVWLAAVIEPK